MTDKAPMDVKAARPTKADYYARATDWAQDREASLRRSRRLAWTVAGVASGIVALQAIALATLVPLKTVVPYTLLVDRHTGYVAALRGIDPELTAPDAALTQALLAQYVIARESFDIATVRQEYRQVALWSGEDAARDYLGLMPATNPASPLRRLPRTTVIATHVRSVTPIGRNVALVRFSTEQLDKGQESGRRSYWVALIRYRFSGQPMALEDRYINPLGFQVVRYRRDQEAPDPPEPAAPPASLVAQTAPTTPSPAVGSDIAPVPPAGTPIQARPASMPVTPMKRVPR